MWARTASSVPSRPSNYLSALTAVSLLALIWSGIRPFDRTTWMLEVLPVIILLPVLWATARRFPLTSLLYVCLGLHALVLIVGGAYTYARVPVGFQIADLLHLERNPYDRIGHFMQGFVPALAVRELLIRHACINGKRILPVIVVCIVLAFSASYELFEWTAAAVLGQGADEFLGTQGDPWDTQADMLCALIGAVTALIVLARMQNRQIAALSAP